MKQKMLFPFFVNLRFSPVVVDDDGLAGKYFVILRRIDDVVLLLPFAEYSGSTTGENEIE